jgi:hypothetical protein
MTLLAWGGLRSRFLISGPLVFSAIVFPTLAYVLLVFPDGVGDAASILVTERFPHHADPKVWFGADDVLRTVVWLIAIGVTLWARQSTLFLILSFGLAYTVVGIMVVLITDDPALAILLPWRGSTVYYPLSWFVLFALPLRTIPYRNFAVGALALFCIALAVTAKPAVDRKINIDGLMAEVAKLPNDAVIMVPPDWQWARMDLRRPIYVDRKNHPYTEDEVFEWWRRLTIAREFFENPECFDEIDAWVEEGKLYIC